MKLDNFVNSVRTLVCDFEENYKREEGENVDLQVNVWLEHLSEFLESGFWDDFSEEN